MFLQLFANFLCERDVINQEQVKNVLAQRRSEKLFLGALAIDIGLMTEDQVERVLHLQTSSPKRFGEIAVAQGFLDEEQLTLLLKVQSKDDLIVIKILTDDVSMEIDTVLEHFEDFKKHYALSEEEFDAIVDQNMNFYVERIAKVDDSFGRFKEFAALFLGYISRTLDKDVLTGEAYHEDAFSSQYVVLQNCKGDETLVIGYTAESDVLSQWASVYADIETDGLDADAIDSLTEFMNCVAGMFAGVMETERNIDIHVEAPRFGKDLSFERAFVLPVHTKYGDAKIIMVER